MRFEAAFVTVSFGLLVAAAGCEPPCNAPAYLELMMAGQRDVVRCPNQHLTDGPDAVAAARACVMEAIAARRPFVLRNNTGRGEEGSAQFFVGRARGNELELFQLFDTDVPSPGARVSGYRCAGFTDFGCQAQAGLSMCYPRCAALVADPPSPPYDGRALSGGVWCGPPYR